MKTPVLNVVEEAWAAPRKTRDADATKAEAQLQARIDAWQKAMRKLWPWFTVAMGSILIAIVAMIAGARGWPLYIPLGGFGVAVGALWSQWQDAEECNAAVDRAFKQRQAIRRRFRKQLLHTRRVVNVIGDQHE